MSAISTVTRAMVAGCDFLQAAASGVRLLDDPRNDQMLKKASLINRLVLCGFTIAESSILIANPQSAKTLETLKVLESLPRLINFPLALLEIEVDSRDREVGYIEFAERMVAPLADMLRVSAEHQYYQENKYLQMSEEERANTTRPIYSEPLDYDDTPHIIGQRPIDLDECRELSERASAMANATAKARIIASAGVVSSAQVLGKNLYGEIANFLRSLKKPSTGINIVDLNFIIPMLQQDVVLKNYICPITDMPIRHPVGDPNGRTIYEKSAIEAWIAHAGTSPVTRSPLRVGNLIPKPAIQALIDSRLQHHQARLEQYIQDENVLRLNLEVPAPCNLAHPALAEA